MWEAEAIHPLPDCVAIIHCKVYCLDCLCRRLLQLRLFYTVVASRPCWLPLTHHSSSRQCCRNHKIRMMKFNGTRMHARHCRRLGAPCSMLRPRRHASVVVVVAQAKRRPSRDSKKGGGKGGTVAKTKQGFGAQVPLKQVRPVKSWPPHAAACSSAHQHSPCTMPSPSFPTSTTTTTPPAQPGHPGGWHHLHR